MSDIEVEALLVEARRSLAQERVASNRRLRCVLAALNSGISQIDVGHYLGLPRAAVRKLVASARVLPTVPDGFSGGSPAEIIEIYVAGEISRERMIDELIRWNYRSTTLAQPTDPVPVDHAQFGQIIDAVSSGDIDRGDYERVVEGLRERACVAATHAE